MKVLSLYLISALIPGCSLSKTTIIYSGSDLYDCLSKQKNRLKNFILVLITALTIGSICAMINWIKIDGFSLAWVLNSLLIFCVVAFTEALKSPLTSSYYNEKK
jgi:hypothetical protein